VLPPTSHDLHIGYRSTAEFAANHDGTRLAIGRPWPDVAVL
jgi:hypothetical protein